MVSWYKMEKTKTPFRIFATLSDVGVLVMSLFYATYIAILFIMDIGVFWLNITLAGLTVAYFIFFVFKILYLNSRTKRFGRLVRLSYKYSKYLARLVNAAIIVISFVNLGLGEGYDIVNVVSIAILVIMLIISVAWDISLIFIRRKIKELYKEWENLPFEQKRDKLEYLARTILNGIDKSGELGNFLLEYHHNRHTHENEPVKDSPPVETN